MQENNNFETIVSTWRRLSGELVETSVLTSMSGDSSNHLPSKKKEEEVNTLVLERPRGPIATAASAALVTSAEHPQVALDPANPPNPENTEKRENDRYDSQDSKEAAGDANYNKEDDEKSFLDNESISSKIEWKKEKGDKVDSVYLRPPPPSKARSNTSSNENDDDCGIKCLYYTVQCCDCVLM